ncbi:hypothetical protein STEG23_021887 [Scotinomys teguina]
MLMEPGTGTTLLKACMMDPLLVAGQQFHKFPTSSDDSTYCESCVQAHKPLGDISHPNHNGHKEDLSHPNRNGHKEDLSHPNHNGHKEDLSHPNHNGHKENLSHPNHNGHK